MLTGDTSRSAVSVLVLHTLLALRTNSSSVENFQLALLKELAKDSRYIRAGADKGVPLDVYLNININDISSVDEAKMDYSVTLYLREFWKDERLARSSYNGSKTLTLNMFDHIWTPDVFVRNIKSGTFHEVTVPNRLIRVEPDGSVLYSQRLTLRLACAMDLWRYPMDNQTCFIDFGSYAYTVEDLVFHWYPETPAIEMSDSINLPEYTITKVANHTCSANYTITGSFPCLSAQIHLQRRLKLFILNTYLPSFLIVLLSWLSFWIDRRSTPARTSLSITTVLTITTHSTNVLQVSTIGSVMKAIDVWMAACTIFVFAAFLEYAVVNSITRRQRAMAYQATANQSEKLPLTDGYKSKAREADAVAPNLWNIEVSRMQSIFGFLQRKPATAADDSNAELQVSWWTVWLQDVINDKAHLVEVISRVLFPLLFLAFNAVYWPLYLH